ncbi:hypothetical protein D3C72_2183820 [compost metagenome]
MDHPVLKLDQLRLQLQQRAEVIDARDRWRVALAVDLADLFRQRRFGKLEFVIFVERIGEFRLQPILSADVAI